MVFLYGSALIPGSFDGVLAHVMITAANLVGPLTGQPVGVLVAEISALSLSRMCDYLLVLIYSSLLVR